jgi:hypothetical protein
MTSREDLIPANAKLKTFAWRVAGPREFVINVVLNGLIAAIAYHNAASMSIAGTASLLAYFGPMFFFLPLITTYCGHLNGVGARRAGVGAPWPQEARWKGTALRSGLAIACVCCPLCICVCLALQAVAPDLHFAKWAGVALIGLVAGIAGCALHGAAVCRSARIGGES